LRRSRLPGNQGCCEREEADTPEDASHCLTIREPAGGVVKTLSKSCKASRPLEGSNKQKVAARSGDHPDEVTEASKIVPAEFRRTLGIARKGNRDRTSGSGYEPNR
jgi:hypothetical protein